MSIGTAPNRYGPWKWDNISLPGVEVSINPGTLVTLNAVFLLTVLLFSQIYYLSSSIPGQPYPRID